MGSDRVLVVLVVLLALLGLVALLASDEEASTDMETPEVENTEPEASAPLEGRRSWKRPLPEDVARRLAQMREREVAREGMKEHFEEVLRRRRENSVALKGVVLDHAGNEIEGAGVFQVDKESSGARPWASYPAGGKTDTIGRFEMRARKPLENYFFVASTGNGRFGWIPGEDVGPGGTVRIVLQAPAELDVFLVDTDGQPLTNAGVRVVPLAGDGLPPALGGFAKRRNEMFEGTDQNGRARFVFGYPIPVTVIPELDGGVADPKERWLPDSNGTVSFTVQKGCTLEVTAKDAETGQTIKQHVWGSVLDPETGREITAGSSDQPNGVLRTDLPLLPGYYDVLVTVRDREPTLVQNVHMAQAGAEMKLTARMPALSEAATLSLVLPPPPALDTDGRKTRGRGRVLPVVFAKRLDGGFDRHGWVRRIDAKPRRDKPGTLDLTMRPGRYELVVSNPNTGRVGHIRQLSLQPGGKPTRRVAMKAGVQFRLYEVLPPDLRVRSLRVEVARIGRFPSAGYDTRLQGTLRSFGGLENNMAPAGSTARKKNAGGPVLGPYPGSTVVLVVTDWQGDTHRLPVRAQ